MLLSDEFSGFVESKKLFRDSSQLAAGARLCGWCFVSATCRDISMRLATSHLTDKQHVQYKENGKQMPSHIIV